jgi:undecaprenyl-diphosphatase
LPVLEPRQRGVARLLDSLPPIGSFLVVALAGYLLLAAAAVAAGFVLTEGLLHVGFIARWDGNVESWFADHRSGWLTEASWVGSTMAGGVVIPAVVGVFACVFAFLRRWRIAAFLLASICIEVATYRVGTLLVHRPRPNVPRLEDLAANASYPSGHTAASIAVYGAIALLVASAFPRTWVRVSCGVLTILIVLFVASSRMYRGMHHPLDAGAGVLIGIGAVVAAVLAARAAGAAVERKRRAR